jgi:threonine aldolase
MILGDTSHMFLFEQGGASQLAGISPRPVVTKKDGTLPLESVEAAIRSDNLHFPVSQLVAIENTHNYCGGRVLPAGYVEALCRMAHRRGLPVHMDGARVWNAAVAAGHSLPVAVGSVDSVSVCLSKGLGAPMGSLLVGPRALIDKARRARKALGGGMRQVGLMAAAGLQALDDFEGGLLESDHRRAQEIADALFSLPGIEIDLSSVETNIVLVHLEFEDGKSSCDPVTFANMLKEKGVLVLPFGPRTIRVMTHRDITDLDVALFISIFRDVAAKVWAQNYSSSPSSSVVMKSILPDRLIDDNNMVIMEDSSVDLSLALVNPNIHTPDHVDEAGDVSPPSPIINFEETSIYGMSVSDEGFCVFLKGLICDRFLKVLVTPADPMRFFFVIFFLTSDLLFFS